MQFDPLDITIESRKNAIWLILSGPLRKDQIPSMREKFNILVDDGNRSLVVDLENVSAIDETVVQMFLNVLNMIRGKGGEIKLIFKNEIVSRAFSPYNNLFPVFPDSNLMDSGGFLQSLKFRHRLLSRKTGIRISRPVAIFLLFVLSGWFVSLIYIYHLQSRYIKKQQTEIHSLREYNQQAKIELEGLRERIKPLEQLGILRDTSKITK